MNDVRQSHQCKTTNMPIAPVDKERLPLRKEEIKCLNGDGFLLYNILSPAECEHYMKESDGVGFDDLVGYKKNYRDSSRVTSFSTELSDLIFERIRPFLPTEVNVPKEKEMEMTAAFGTAGKWNLKNMNECWRFCRYAPGGLFAPHLDGCFVRNISERSFYTFMIYLNKGFEGGATNFLKNDTELSMVDGKYVSDDSNIVEQVFPEPGMALIFMHPHMHEGAVLKSGNKYIMRSDIMFTRETKLVTTPKEEEAVLLFEKAQELEISDPMKAADLYRRAFKLSPALADAYRA